MELWVRTQNREELVKVDNIRIKHEYEQKKVNDNYGRVCTYINGEYRCSYIYSDSTCLGEYATKERALQVLDEIQKLLEPKFVLHTEEIEKPITEYMCTIEQIKDIKELSTRVYEMPSE